MFRRKIISEKIYNELLKKSTDFVIDNTIVNYEVIRQLVKKALDDEFSKLGDQKQDLDQKEIQLTHRAKELISVEGLEIRNNAEIHERKKKIKADLDEAERRETDNPAHWQQQQAELRAKLEEFEWLIKLKN